MALIRHLECSARKCWQFKKEIPPLLIKARLVVTVWQLPVRQGQWEPTHCESLPPSPSAVSTPPAWPSSAAIGFGFLAAAWSLHTFSKLCHFTVQTWVAHRWARDIGMWYYGLEFASIWDLALESFRSSCRYGSITADQMLVLWRRNALRRSATTDGHKSIQSGNWTYTKCNLNNIM